MDRQAMKRILTAGIVGIFVLAAVQPVAGQSMKVSKGEATVQVGGQTQKLGAGQSTGVKAGAKVTIPAGGTVTIPVANGCSVILEENSVVKVNKVQAPAGKKAGTVNLEVMKGGVRTDVIPPAKDEKRAQKQPKVNFEIKVGDMTATGTSFSGRIARLEKKSYRAQTMRGEMRIEEGYLLVRLSGKQSITRLMSSIILKAGSNNKGPVAVAFSGAMIMQLQPGQSARLEPMEGPTGVWVQNLDPQNPLQVTNWEGLPTRTLAPQQRRLFVVVERDVPTDLAWTQMEKIAGQIEAPTVAAPRRRAQRRYVRPVIMPRHDRISAAQ